MQTDEEIGKVAAAVPVIICILFCSLIYFKFKAFYHDRKGREIGQALISFFIGGFIVDGEFFKQPCFVQKLDLKVISFSKISPTMVDNTSANFYVRCMQNYY